jgi:hypothetical protein
LLEDRGHAFGVNSTSGGIPLLALRHLDPPTGAEDAFVVAAPSVNGGTVGPFVGGVAVQTNTQLWGTDANILHALCWSRNFHLVGLAGFRYLDLDETIDILTRKAAIGSSSLTFLGNSFGAPAFELTNDRFRGRSQFFGGQLGLRGEYFFKHCFIAASGKLALGRTDEVENALGISTLQPHNAPPQVAGGGLYALPTNSGRFLNQDFGVVPEVQVKGGVLLTSWLRATVGYNFLYWSRVLRAGNEVNLTVDARQVPTDPSYKAGTVVVLPRPVANATDFWVQGLTFGLEWTF